MPFDPDDLNKKNNSGKGQNKSGEDFINSSFAVQFKPGDKSNSVSDKLKEGVKDDFDSFKDELKQNLPKQSLQRRKNLPFPLSPRTAVHSTESLPTMFPRAPTRATLLFSAAIRVSPDLQLPRRKTRSSSIQARILIMPLLSMTRIRVLSLTLSAPVPRKLTRSLRLRHTEQFLPV